MSTDENKIITNEFEALKRLRILVLGDVMIDSYLWGSVDRMSPEAPVPVVSVKKREKRLGGAANVAKNLKALGIEPIVVSVIGNDPDGQEMLTLFENNNLSTEGLISTDKRVTTIKHRIISDQHLLRVDSEQTDEIDDQLKSVLIDSFESLIKGASCVVFQDYDKGVLGDAVIKKCVEISNNFGVPSTVDPKNRNFYSYSNVTLFKPNLKEINEGLGEKLQGDDIDGITKAARTLIKKNKIQKVLITLSEYGALLVTSDDAFYVKAHKRDIVDVSGAGDTVISVASAFIALGVEDIKVLKYSNLSGGLVCEKIGVVPINENDLIREVKLLSL